MFNDKLRQTKQKQDNDNDNDNNQIRRTKQRQHKLNQDKICTLIHPDRVTTLRW